MSNPVKDLDIFTFRSDNPSLRPTYTCSLPGNNQGDFVRLEEYKKLLKDAKAMAEFIVSLKRTQKFTVLSDEYEIALKYTQGEQ